MATSVRYHDKIDGLRTLAVTAVLLQHFAGVLHVGTYGVKLFFVISGFLITAILLRMKDDTGGGFARATGVFCARRVLRILPAYYLLLAIGIAINLQGVQQFALWHLFHGSNLLAVVNSTLSNPWWTSHFWSLAVEEQFYLVWPVLLLPCPRALVMPFILVLVCAGYFFGLNGPAWFPEYPYAGEYVPVSALDELGAGAFLAAYRHFVRAELPRLLRAFLIGAGLVSLGLTIAYAYQVLPPFVTPWLHVAKPLIIVGFVALVDYAATPANGGAVSRLLTFKPIVGIGRISYGIYLYHLPVYLIVDYVCRVNNLPWNQYGWPNFFLSSGLTIIVSYVSWRMVEEPINSLKRFFPYSAKKPHGTNVNLASLPPSRA
jgi:peptidoglycan/LPS O-acetylase OafA/YrhL